MDDSLVFRKSPLGEAAVRDRARLPRPNLRAVLIVVDGQATVGTLKQTLGDPAMLEAALAELEEQGLIARAEGGADGPRMEKTSVAGPSSDALAAQDSRPPRVPDVASAEAAASCRGDETVGVEGATSDGSCFQGTAKSGGPRGSRVQGLEDPAVSGPSYQAATPAYKDRTGRKCSRTRKGAGPWVALGLLVALVLAVIRLVFYPYDEFRPGIEAALSRIIGDRVSVGVMRVSFLPRPVIVLEKLSLGNTPYASIETARIPLDIASLSNGEVRAGGEARLEGVRIDERGLAEAGRLLTHAAPAEIGVTTIVVEGLGLLIGGQTMCHFSGRASAGAGGIGNLAVTDREDHLRLEVAPAKDGVSLGVMARYWPLPFRPSLIVSSMEATARLSPGALRIDRYEGAALGGRFVGQGSIEWREEVKVDFDAEMRSIDAKALIDAWQAPALLEGSASGRLTITGKAKEAAGLSGQLRTRGQFRITRGALRGIDLAEALQVAATGSADAVSGGVTNFEAFAATLAIDERSVRLSGVRIAAGRLHAAGHAELHRSSGTLSGTLEVTLDGSEARRGAVVRLAGTAARPELRVR